MNKNSNQQNNPQNEKQKNFDYYKNSYLNDITKKEKLIIEQQKENKKDRFTFQKFSSPISLPTTPSQQNQSSKEEYTFMKKVDQISKYSKFRQRGITTSITSSKLNQSGENLRYFSDEQ